VSKKIDGFNWGIGSFSLGNISTHTFEIEVCKIAQPNDYKIVSDWISKISN
jgi:hypothetical protein